MSFLSSILPIITGGIGGFLGGPAVAAAGATVGGGVSSAIAQGEANDANIAQTQKQMDFQERMSSSAYQRATSDMVKAGINPALAISQGGASSPSGAAASIEPVDFGQGAAGAIGTAVDLQQKTAATKKIQSDTGLNAGVAAINQAQAKKINEETRITSADATRAEQTSKFYKDHPWLVPLKETLGTSSSAMGQAAQGALIYKALKPGSTSNEADPSQKDKNTLYNSYLKNRPKHLRKLQ